MNCPYCGTEARNGVCERCGSVTTPTRLTGWRPDPTARHEGRFYTAGKPTNRVRDGKKRSSDPTGAQLLPDHLELPDDRSSIRSTWLGTGAASAILVLVTAVAWILMSHGPHSARAPEQRYLSALDDAGLSNIFNSDVNAVAHGRQVCRQLQDGGAQQGLPADKLAVDAFCPDFVDGFRILESATIPGVFVLIDSGQHAITSDGTSCEGTGGYSDIGRTTAVTVKNGKGEILTSTALGQGKGAGGNCTFSFSFTLTEGQDRYVVSVGHRGEFIYTFEQIRAKGVQIKLGS